LRFAFIALMLCLPGAALAAADVFQQRQPACLACHGENGVSPTPEVPSLGGIPEFYALLQLVEFRDGNRDSGIMREVVKGMSDDDLRAAATFVAQQPRPPAPAGSGDPEQMKRGAALAAKGRCAQCHGAKLLGGHQMPPLRNQREDYLLKALLDYKAQRRLGERAAMVEVVAPLNEEDLRALAHYMAHLKD
jgi:cytochrome c553